MPAADPLAMLRSLDFLDDLHSLLPPLPLTAGAAQSAGCASCAPRLFLDVDGVIAPSSIEPLSDADVVWVDSPATGRLHFRVDVLARLVSLHERRIVSVEWLTSRQETAPEVMAPALGLPVWPLHLRREAPPWWQVPYETTFWKERYVYVALEAGDCVVWCDDDIAFRANHEELAAFDDRLLKVCPSSPHGLTLQDMDTIEAWAVQSRRCTCAAASS